MVARTSMWARNIVEEARRRGGLAPHAHCDIKEIAADLGIGRGALREWLEARLRDSGRRHDDRLSAPGLQSARIRRLEAENVRAEADQVKLSEEADILH